MSKALGIGCLEDFLEMFSQPGRHSFLVRSDCTGVALKSWWIDFQFYSLFFFMASATLASVLGVKSFIFAFPENLAALLQVRTKGQSHLLP